MQHNFQLTNMSQLGARNLCYNIARALSRDARMQIASKQFCRLGSTRVAPILSNLRIDALGGGMFGRWYLQNSDRHADIPRIQFKLKVPLISWKIIVCHVFFFNLNFTHAGSDTRVKSQHNTHIDPLAICICVG